MKGISLALSCLVSFPLLAQSSAGNLDFEQLYNGTPVGWLKAGKVSEFKLSIDETTVQSGEHSVSIEHTGEQSGFAAWAQAIPVTFDGETITLRGYIKTEGVTNGRAALMVRIEPSIAFDTMERTPVIGTTDWQRYEITVPYKSAEAKRVIIGGMLAGEGKVWFDNMELLVDGKPIADEKQALAAEKDTAFDQGSGIELSALNQEKIANLALLGKVWGFLKYHHPAVATGGYNWDYQLFRVLPDYMKATTNHERDQFLLNWIKNLGDVELCTQCQATSEDAVLKPDHSWIGSNLSRELQDKLNFVYQNRHQGRHFYIADGGVGNPDFIRENEYSKMPFPDDGFRLLSLFRYWNMIQYYFPYKHLIDKNWHEVLTEYVPLFVNANSELAYERLAVRLVGEVQDTHANVYKGDEKFEAEKGKYFPPVYTRMIEGKLVVADYYTESKTENDAMAKKVGLNIGDVITTINDTSVDKLIEQRLVDYPASNYPTKLRDIAPDLLRSNNKTVDIEFIRDKTLEKQTLALYPQEELFVYSKYRREPKGKSYKMLDNNIGYVTLKNITPEEVEAIKKEFADTKGIIIDIRNYPSTFVPFSLGGFLVDSPTAFAKFTVANLNNPGEFNFRSGSNIPPADSHYKGKVVVLVNEISQSQSEYTAMAFRASKKTTIVGSTTAAADGNVSPIELPGGLVTYISGIGVYYPDGTETQRVGIVPDIEVLPTISGIKAGRDEVLEKAIEVIKSH
ncbi:S41 family peptidase [Thalassotalea marina]|uniref:Tail specific protease domain-containing protein n=1 Tax=Thalassotalea marina TaxID=1673741 RepID=A0A919BLL9_9GAMM|nr:S41 family peptidase [Thalassotalea marina]GHF97628.1 hypothetical protein GCM10017161_27290 [Thalassotalea marina]